MQAFLVSTGAVALGEIGDKTQLLALLLATRFRRPWPIVAGILVATLANHALAGALGTVVAKALDPLWLRGLLGATFLLVAGWLLVPDRAGDGPAPGRAHGALGIFGVTALAFFVAEMGDKTQVATVLLAARFDALLAVTAGTTLGMLMANVPVVVFGPRALGRLPLAWVQRAAALLFAALGVLALAGVGV